MPDYITKNVRLASATRDDGEAAVDQLEEIFDEYGWSDDTLSLSLLRGRWCMGDHVPRCLARLV